MGTLSRRTVAITSLTLVSCGLMGAACGQGAPGDTSTTGSGRAPSLKAGSTITFWNDASMGGGYPSLMQRWGEQFAQKTGVKVEATGGIGGYEDKISAAFAGGQPPDVYRYLQENVPLPAALEQNRLLKLDQFVKRDKTDLSDFRKDSLALYQWRGFQLALPRDYGLQLVYYNTELFQRAGLQPIPTDWNEKSWTFQKFLEVCQTLARGGERYALLVNRGVRPWASWVYSNGGTLVKKNADGLATEVALAEKPAVDALQFVQDLIYKHKVAPEPAQESALGGTSRS